MSLDFNWGSLILLGCLFFLTAIDYYPMALFKLFLTALFLTILVKNGMSQTSTKLDTNHLKDLRKPPKLDTTFYPIGTWRNQPEWHTAIPILLKNPTNKAVFVTPDSAWLCVVRVRF